MCEVFARKNSFEQENFKNADTDADSFDNDC
jgi:hypothetical protein